MSVEFAKAEAAQKKAAVENEKKAAVEDEDWGKGAKSTAKKYGPFLFSARNIPIARRQSQLTSSITGRQRPQRKPNRLERRQKKMLLISISTASAI